MVRNPEQIPVKTYDEVMEDLEGQGGGVIPVATFSPDDDKGNIFDFLRKYGQPEANWVFIKIGDSIHQLSIIYRLNLTYIPS